AIRAEKAKNGPLLCNQIKPIQGVRLSIMFVKTFGQYGRFVRHNTLLSFVILPPGSEWRPAVERHASESEIHSTHKFITLLRGLTGYDNFYYPFGYLNHALRRGRCIGLPWPSRYPEVYS